MTVFAPTNDAMQAFLTAMSLTQQDLLKNELLCDALLRHHVSPVVISKQMITRRSKAQTLEPYSYLTLQNPTGALEVSDMQGNTAIVLNGDIAAGEGIIHIIDRVLQSGKGPYLACKISGHRTLWDMFWLYRISCTSMQIVTCIPNAKCAGRSRLIAIPLAVMPSPITLRVLVAYASQCLHLAVRVVIKLWLAG